MKPLTLMIFLVITATLTTVAPLSQVLGDTSAVSTSRETADRNSKFYLLDLLRNSSILSVCSTPT